MALASLVPFQGPGVSRTPSPPLTHVIHSPLEIYYTRGQKNQRSINSYYGLRGLRKAWQGHCLTYGDGEMSSPWCGQYSQGGAETIQAGIPSPPKWRGVCASSLLALLYPNHPFKQAENA